MNAGISDRVITWSGGGMIGSKSPRRQNVHPQRSRPTPAEKAKGEWLKLSMWQKIVICRKEQCNRRVLTSASILDKSWPKAGSVRWRRVASLSFIHLCDVI